MSISRISSRYAKSLLDLAIETNELESVLKDMETFNEVSKNRDFYLMMKSPIINSSKKLSIFKAIFENKIGKTTLAFFNIVIKKSREIYLPEIGLEFISQYKKYNKISTVVIISATPLNDASLAEIKSKLLNSAITMEKLEIITKVDPSLIGGFIIEAGDKLYDASISYNLEQLKKEFVDNQYVK